MPEPSSTVAFAELAQAALAINLAYFSLDRFRYNALILKKCDLAVAGLAGIPAAVVRDSAVKEIHSSGNPYDVSTWPGNRVSFWFYIIFFKWGIDRWLTGAFSLLTMLLLALMAYFEIYDGNIKTALGIGTLWDLYLAVLIAAVFPGGIVLFGRHCVKMTHRKICKNLTTVAVLIKTEVKEEPRIILETIRRMGLVD